MKGKKMENQKVVVVTSVNEPPDTEKALLTIDGDWEVVSAITAMKIKTGTHTTTETISAITRVQQIPTEPTFVFYATTIILRKK